MPPSRAAAGPVPASAPRSRRRRRAPLPPADAPPPSSSPPPAPEVSALAGGPCELDLNARAAAASPRTGAKARSRSGHTPASSSTCTTAASTMHSSTRTGTSTSAGRRSCRSHVTSGRRRRAAAGGGGSGMGSGEEASATPSSVERALRAASDQCGGVIKPPSLLRAVAAASSFSSASASWGGAGGGGASGGGGGGGLLLEEKLEEVMGAARKCLRASASSSRGGGTPLKTPKKGRGTATPYADGGGTAQGLGGRVANLRVALHCLRAVCPVVAGSVGGGDGHKYAENALRLLYHTIVASEDAFLDATRSAGGGGRGGNGDYDCDCDGDGDGDGDGIESVRLDAALICLASCSVLSRFLCDAGASAWVPAESFQLAPNASPLVQGLAQRPEGVGLATVVNPIQVAKISCQSLLSAAAVLSSLLVQGLRRGLNQDWGRGTDEFGLCLSGALESDLSAVRSLCYASRTTSPPRRGTAAATLSFQWLIRHVANLWVYGCYKLSKGCNGDEVPIAGGLDSALSFSKRYQRLLWDCASRIDEIGSMRDDGADLVGLRQLSLGLRADSILVSLLALAGEGGDQGSKQYSGASAELRSAILKDRFEGACTCAWKAAASFSHSITLVTNRDSTWYGSLGQSKVGTNVAFDSNQLALKNFHEKVGPVLNCLEKMRLEYLTVTKSSHHPACMAYIEYCAYRAIHNGPMNGHCGRGDSNYDRNFNRDGDSCALGEGGDPIQPSHHHWRCKTERCFFSKLPFEFVHHCEFCQKEVGETIPEFRFVILAVLFTSLDIFSRCGIDLSRVSSKNDGATSFQIGFDIGDSLLSIINTYLSPEKKQLETPNLIQCQKILSHIKLTTRVMDIIKSFEARKAPVSETTFHAVSLVAKVLKQCYCPILSLLVVLEKIPKGEKNSRLEMAQDGYIRCAMLYDRLHEWNASTTDDSSYLDSSDMILRRLFDLSSEQLTRNTVLVAKSIGAIGKRRNEKEGAKSALIPLVLSTELFVAMFETGRDASFKLPTRFIQIGTMFESLGMLEEALAALVLAAHYQMRDCGDNNMVDACNAMISFPEIFDGIHGQMNKTKTYPILVRLIRVLSKYQSYGKTTDSDSSDRKSITIFWNILQQSRVGLLVAKTTGKANDGKEIRPFLISRAIYFIVLRSDHEGLSFTAKMQCLREVIYILGKALANLITSTRIRSSHTASIVEDPNIETMSKEFATLLKFGLESKSKLYEAGPTTKECHFYEAGMYLSASASFFNYCSQHSSASSVTAEIVTGDIYPNLLLSAFKYAKQANVILENIAEDEERSQNDEMLHVLFGFVADYCLWEISQKRGALGINSCCEELLSRAVLITTYLHGHEKVECKTAVIRCVAFVLVKIQSRLEYAGAYVGATHAADLLVQLAQIGHESPKRMAATGANLIMSLLGGQLNGTSQVVLLKYLRQVCNNNAADVETAIQASIESFVNDESCCSPIQLVVLSLALLAKSQASNVNGHVDIVHDLKIILRLTSIEDVAYADDSILWSQMRWAQSTCLLALAHCMERYGSVQEALSLFLQNGRVCQSAISKMRNCDRDDASIRPRNDWMDFMSDPNIEEFRFKGRLYETLQSAANMYCRLGDYWRGDSYALAATELINALPRDCTKLSKSSANDILALLQDSTSKASCRQAEAILNLVNIHTLSMDTFMISIEARKQDVSFKNSSWKGPDWTVQAAKGLMLYGDIIQRGLKRESTFKVSQYKQAQNEVANLGREVIVNDFVASVVGKETNLSKFEQLRNESTLRVATHLEKDGIFHQKVLESDYISGLTRAFAHYHLGIQALTKARKNGDLYNLWRENCTFTGSEEIRQDVREDDFKKETEDIECARAHLYRAASLAGPASSLLSRQIMRSLALVTGPNHNEPGYSAAALIHSSIGSTQRQKVCRAYPRNESDANFVSDALRETLLSLFQSMDAPLNDRDARNLAFDSMLMKASKTLPRSWKFVAMAICPTGEVLISRFLPLKEEGKFEELTVCIFSDFEDHGESTIYHNLLQPFDELMQRSREQLKDMDSTSHDRYSDGETKRRWWDIREKIDHDLRLHLNKIDHDYFSSDVVRQVLNRVHSDIGRCDGLECSLGNLTEKFDAACSVNDENLILNETLDPSNLTVAKIKEELARMGIHKNVTKKMRKPALVELLTMEAKKHRNSLKPQVSTSSFGDSSQVQGNTSECTFLILDEELQRFPFEGLPSMEGRSICRVPSISFAVASILERKFSPVRAQDGRYVLDPEGNLASTKRTMLDGLNSLTSSLQLKWEGIAGEQPPAAFMKKALTTERGLFLYCGHGGGEKCFSRSQVEGLLKDERAGIRPCASTLILMGCSSGKLVSVNSSRTGPPQNISLAYEPEGIVMSYLCAGAPCVVGNLWDVTDRDIDRYCMALLEDFLGANAASFQGRAKSLPECVADARLVCKMRNIVGCAPVVYGVPVVAESSMDGVYTQYRSGH